MARVTVEDCLKNVDSRFTLVHLAVRRVLQLRHGAPPTMENTKGNKEVVLALREIAAQNITVDNIRLIEESRPAPVEVATPVEQAAERVELKEILEEATSFNLSAEYDDADQLIEGDPDQDRTAQEED
ncbi:MAG: DNA-directed RNA polymerase subunit omega [Desulfobacteraceae bacterium]|nr:DNA-directed RNA polymerase subunit omega [Desulfobacteraceae bacterium]